jgi:hypothetical protein
MKYKVVVKTKNETFVKKRSKNKEHLEDYALGLSKKHPRWTVYVVREETTI